MLNKLSLDNKNQI